MEMIKFSELPSGDRMDLNDEDGLPIIASQENRLLTWGRLKKQLAKQTHTDDTDLSDANKDKVITMTGLENRLTGLSDEFQGKIDDVVEKADDAMAKAEGADATAKSALGSAGSASADAQSARSTAEATQTIVKALQDSEEQHYNDLEDKISTNATAQQKLREDLAAEATTRTEVISGVKTELSSVASRVGEIESKIASGELGGGNSSGGESSGSVDLTPVNNRLAALEEKDTNHDTRLDTLETDTTSQANKLTEVESAAATAQATAESARRYGENAQKMFGELSATVEEVKDTANAAKTASILTNAELAGLSVVDLPEGQTEGDLLVSNPKTLENATLKDIAEQYNLNFEMLMNVINQLSNRAGGSGKYTLTDTLKHYSVGTTETDSGIVFNGGNWGWSGGYRPGDEVEVSEVLTCLLENQARFAVALQETYFLARERQQDIAAIMNNITNTLNSVTA